MLATAATYAGAAYFYLAFDISLLGTHEGDSMTYFTLQGFQRDSHGVTFRRVIANR
ncbi:hypothetical protein ACODNH_20990 (plasmid) [Haloarcula sp. NS06]|uniref:hypothetical protein n=1 Tax=Haloarcula sp. NS06 TaxID=3409688 RepID=UPI003DA7298E